MSEKLRVGIVNRFQAGRRYLLGDEFAAAGLSWVQVDLASAVISSDGKLESVADDVDVFIWRLSEGVAAAALPLRTALQRRGVLVNTAATIDLCADKWQTHLALLAAGVPSLETLWVPPGGAVPSFGARTIFKPSCGAGGRDVRFALPGERLNRDATEAWIAQPWVGRDEDHVRVLVVNDKAVKTYRRVRTDASPVIVNNVEAGAVRVDHHDSEAVEVALAASAAVGAEIAGVDLVPGPWRVLEVNSNPGVPPDSVPAVAAELVKVFRRVTGS